MIIDPDVKNRKKQIKQVAQNLFREKGYAATSMRDLARHVGIEPASLYSHITSKEAILREICFRIADEFFEALDSIRVLNLPPSEKLKRAIIAHLDVIRNNIDAATVFLHEWRFMNEPNLSRFKSLRRTYEFKFREIVEDGIRAGELKNIPVKIVLPTLLSSMNWAYEHVKPSDHYTTEEIGERIYSIFYNGIKIDKTEE